MQLNADLILCASIGVQLPTCIVLLGQCISQENQVGYEQIRALHAIIFVVFRKNAGNFV